MGRPEATIIIPARNEGFNLQHTVDSILRTEARDMALIVVVNDGSQDRCCDFISRQPSQYECVELLKTGGIGAAQARNLGADRALTRYLVFCDGHVLVGKGWLEHLIASLELPDVDAVVPGIGPFDPSLKAGYGQTWDERLEIRWLDKPQGLTEVPLAPGACLAIKRSVFESVGGFDRGFKSWGYEDVEISIKLWLFGYRICVDPDVRVGHRFRKTPPYRVDGSQFLYNRLRMAASHLKEERIAKVIEMLPPSRDASLALARLLLDDTVKQRSRYFNLRRYDDDWFFHRFNIDF